MDALSKEIFGDRSVSFQYENDKVLIIRQKEMDFFGRNFEPQDYAEVVAAVDDSSITVDYDEADNVIVIDTEHDFYEINVRTIGIIDGKKTIENVIFAVQRPPALEGTGARVTARQAIMAQFLGFDQIILKASGEPGDQFIGYYVWPRLGYNGDISNMRVLLDEAGFDGVEDTNTLMQRPGGALWWKCHGVKGSRAFDLRKGSTSFKVLNNYLEEKNIVVVD